MNRGLASIIEDLPTVEAAMVAIRNSDADGAAALEHGPLTIAPKRVVLKVISKKSRAGIMAS
jgi:hypothetical protein